MGEDPAGGVRRKKDATLVRAAEAVRDGTASAMVSAGNTGATMASHCCAWGGSRSEQAGDRHRPARPGKHQGDRAARRAGANAECQPEWLVQFAQMGSVFARHRFGLGAPRVGLLSIGEENTKGNTLVKEARAAGGHLPAWRSSATSRAGTSSPTTWTSSSRTSSAATSFKSLEGALPAIMGGRAGPHRHGRAVGPVRAAAPDPRRALREPGTGQLRRGHAPRRPRGVHHQPRLVEREGHVQRHQHGP